MYYLRDRDAETSERVLFTHTENVPTQDPDKALKWMAWTAMHAEEIKRQSGEPHTGHVCRKPVFTLSLSWNPDKHRPDQAEMIRAGKSVLEKLKLDEHESLFVAHSDGVPHIHLITNTVHPVTGKVNRLSHSKLALSAWAQAYEDKHGLEDCPQRRENNKKRAAGNFVKYKEPEFDFKAQIARMYHASDSGAAFNAAMEQAGYKLAQGKRVVVIDADGKVHSLSRQIEDVKAKDIRAKISDLQLPGIDEAHGIEEPKIEEPQERKEKPNEAKAKNKQTPAKAKDPKGARKTEDVHYFDRDEQDRRWQESIIDAALAQEETSSSSVSTTAGSHKPQPASPQGLNASQDHRLDELGRFYDQSLRAKAQLHETLETAYGERERQLRNEAEHLDRVLTRSGPVRKFWLKLTGQVPKTAEQDLEAMRKGLADIEMRRSEAQSALEADIARQRAEIERQHEADGRRLNVRLYAESRWPLIPSMKRKITSTWTTIRGLRLNIDEASSEAIQISEPQSLSLSSPTGWGFPHAAEPARPLASRRTVLAVKGPLIAAPSAGAPLTAARRSARETTYDGRLRRDGEKG